MKKVLLLIIGLSFFSFNSTAQTSWEKVYSNDDVLIEMKIEDCNPNDRLVPNSYALLRYSNKTNTEITIDFEMLLEYNGILQDNTPNDSGDPAKITTLTIAANSNITATCDSNEKYLKIFYKHNHPEINNRLTNIEIITK